MSYLSIVAVMFCFYSLQFIYGQRVQNNAIVDIFWGIGFVLGAWFTLLYNSAYASTALVTVVLITLWGVRLSYHLFLRNRGKPEDFRYVNFRRAWGNRWVKTKAFLQVYMLQMLMLLCILSAPVHTILANRSEWHWSVTLGIIVWCMGYFFEVRADWELRQFKKDGKNRGQILTTGLYKYSRHPNYFGEATMWWGIYILGLASGGVLWIISPVTITVLVRYVSGVPMLEKHYENHAAYQAYTRKTSIFIPWFPKE